jgi:hypothetical protein
MDKKKMIMVAVIVVCLGLAAALTFTRTSDKSGIETIDSSEKVWVKCNNPSCGAESEMSAKEYFATTDKKRANPVETPPLVCQKCKQESVYMADKCKNCGKLFFRSRPKPGEYPDRCSYCGHSYLEDLRKQATAPATQ